jgi:CRP/FNR family cyclic AMP-dependent transcriptional regulator
MKMEKSNDCSQILMGSLLLWAVGQPVYGNALGLCLHTRQRDGRGAPQRAPRNVASHVDAEGGTQTRRAREEGAMSEIKLKKTVSFLAQVPLFRNLDKRQLHSLAQSMTPRRYAAGETVLRQGKGGIGLYVVLSGRTEAVHTRADGTRVVVNAFGPADYFGELAMLNDEPRTASVVAVEDTECLVLVRWDFLGKLRRNRGMATVILQEQSRRFQRALSVL